MELLRINVNNVLCDVLATWHDDGTNKDFIFYTDNQYIDNKLNIYYGLYMIQDGVIKVSEIVNNEDEELALRVMKEIINFK